MNILLPSDCDIDFNFHDSIKQFPFPDIQFRKWIFSVIQNEGHEPGVISFIFCNDDFLTEMNRKYLDHDTLTDIITFDYSQDFGNISGDIFVSIDRVEENAKVFDSSFFSELARVLVHGVLHICGYRDKTDQENTEMRTKENQYLSMIDFL